MKILGLTIAAFAAASLIACGGGGGGSSDITSQFIDSPVQGLYYSSTSGKTGTTDAAGNFTVASGDTVTFKIGGKDGLEIGTAKPTKDAPIFVTDLPGGMQVAQILQSLDLGGDSNTKLDLSQITSIPDATKAALSDHIKSGNLTDGQTILSTAQAAIKTAIPALAAKTFPTPPDAAAINRHLLASAAKLPPAIPSLDGKVYVLVQKSDTSNQKFSLIGFQSGKVKYFTNETGLATGAYRQSGETLEVTFDSYQKHNESTPSAVNCTLNAKFKKFDAKLPGAFEVNSTFSASCPSTEAETDTFVAIDRTPTLDGFKGKTFNLTGETSLSSNANNCDTISWTFSTNLALTSTTTSSNYCGVFRFGGSASLGASTVKTLSDDASFIFSAPLDYSSISETLKGGWLFMKIAGVEDVGLLLWASNFEPPTSSGVTPSVDNEGMRIRKAAPMKFTKQ